MKQIGKERLDLPLTLMDSAQCFRWQEACGRFGAVLRAKGIVPATDSKWIHFDYVPGEHQVRTGAADVTGRLCVIGSKLDEKALDQLFKL